MADTSLPSTSPQPCGESLVLQDLLPDILYELLGVAINDARQFDRDRYFPISYWWHRPNDEGHCQVCLAGSLIAGTLEATPDQSFTPDHFDSNVRGNLESLNYMRQGHWLFAFYEFYRHWPRTCVENRLRKLPQPNNANFRCWNTFHSHLDFLESTLPELREIELSKLWF